MSAAYSRRRAGIKVSREVRKLLLLNGLTAVPHRLNHYEGWKYRIVRFSDGAEIVGPQRSDTTLKEWMDFVNEYNHRR